MQVHSALLHCRLWWETGMDPDAEVQGCELQRAGGMRAGGRGAPLHARHLWRLHMEGMCLQAGSQASAAGRSLTCARSTSSASALSAPRACTSASRLLANSILQVPSKI